jgi:hypothetical protein
MNMAVVSAVVVAVAKTQLRNNDLKNTIPGSFVQKEHARGPAMVLGLR